MLRRPKILETCKRTQTFFYPNRACAFFFIVFVFFCVGERVRVCVFVLRGVLRLFVLGVVLAGQRVLLSSV